MHSLPLALDAARLGIDYDTLSRENPRLIYCDISMLERTGPDADLAETDLTVQGRVGLPRFLGRRGEPLARLEAEVALTATLERFPALRLAPRGVERDAAFDQRGPQRLMLIAD